MASIGTASDATPGSRVAFVPEENVLSLRWETGDVISLQPKGSTETFDFKAQEYVHRSTGALEKVEEGVAPTLEQGDELVYFFEYDGSATIPNASAFTGRATCTPAASDITKLKQSANGDASHLRECEYLMADLSGVDLTRNVTAWTSDGIDEPVVFSQAGDYAFLQIVTDGFKYSIWGGGKLKVFIIDESTKDTREEYTPDAVIQLGDAPTQKISFNGTNHSSLWPNLEAKGFRAHDVLLTNMQQFPITNETQKPFIYVPERYVCDGDYFVSHSDTSLFEPYTEHYAADDITGTFYVPIQAQRIEAVRYIAVVLECGWSKDLYVWDKKVPSDCLLEGGKLYLLDYRDKKPDYGICIVPYQTYFRDKYLEQDVPGLKGKAPRYTLLGEKAPLGGVSRHPNRVVGFGTPAFTGDDVETMKDNHGAFYMTDGSAMCAICPRSEKHWKRSASGAWLYDTNGKLIMEGTGEAVNYVRTKTYMQKLTCGVINQNSTYHIGADNNNCYEYVLKDEFDPVMRSGKISNLWRTPFGRDLGSLARISSSINFVDKTNGVLTIESTRTGHRICLPMLDLYRERDYQTCRGKLSDGSDGKESVWEQVSYNTIYRVSLGRSVRSFGASNPAYLQTISVSHTNTDGLLGFVANFNYAMPVIPVFRCVTTDTNEGLISW